MNQLRGIGRVLFIGCIALIYSISTVPSAWAMPTEEMSEEGSSKRIVIVSASGDVEIAVDVVERTISSATIRHVYKDVYGGFSLEIDEKDINRLSDLSVIQRVDDIAHYQPSLEGSILLLGRANSTRSDSGSSNGLTGKGVKVGVIDTGVDYKHPDLRNNYKGGYDIIDEDDDPMETKMSQGPPTLHGTHVAGIIAANGRIKGVAPEAEIYAYRALGPGGQGTTEQVLEAIEKAVADEVDVINLSLGNTVNGPDWPTSLALDRVAEKGVVAVASSGNSGPNMWTVGSPGTSSKAISVGASLPPVEFPYLTVKQDKDKRIELIPLAGSNPWTLKRELELVDMGHGLIGDYKDKQVKGKLVLVKRGRSTFADKMSTAKKAGAAGILVYNHLDGDFTGGTLEPIDLIGGSVSKEVGEELVALIHESKKPVHVQTKFEQKQDLIAGFSSRGPVTETWEMKPDLVAPGVAIQSTVPNGYFALNGTSMASPHVAGAAALLIQKHPDWTPEQIKAALMNSTKRLKNEQGVEYLPHEQGAGRLQVDKALEATTLVYPSSLTFGAWSGKAAQTRRTLSVTIENTSDQENRFTIDPPIGELDGVNWESVEDVTIPPMQKREVTLTAEINPALLQNGLHTGHVKIKGDGSEVNLPYMLFMEEPNYPRVMAFQFAHSDKAHGYYYEYYLPGGAEESGVALYDPDTFEFKAHLVKNEKSARGMVSGELDHLTVEPGRYKALIYAKNEGKEDTIESFIDIGEEWLPPVKKER
ncbi:LOW QUALITY PROTEIN: subtilase family domain protein [Bacillus sp. JCM 19046]|nr:LOW QUALITY PROTEIN: subtilase family domain protein [Bacillus sp. JCM 19046]